MKVIGCALFAAVVLAAPAYAVSYTTDTATYSGVGDQIGSSFDVVSLGGVNGTITTPGVYAFNNVSFTVGINATADAVSSGFFTDTATIGASTFTYTVPYTISISGADSITIGGNTFQAAGYSIFLNPLTLGSDGTFVATGILAATVTPAAVPEPASWAMMLGGFGMMGGVLRSRRKATLTFA